MSSKTLLATVLVALGTAACGGPSTVHRGATLPPPGEAQLSPHDADVQWPGHDRDSERDRRSGV